MVSAMAAKARPSCLDRRCAYTALAPCCSSLSSSSLTPTTTLTCTQPTPRPNVQLPLVGDESIMSKKAHGTTDRPVQQGLRWGCSQQTADKIVSFNRHYAEHSGYWLTTNFLEEEPAASGEPITFRDSVTGAPLFRAPIGRSWDAFVTESRQHGWPSFRDEEVVWDNVRVLRDGEAVSVTGSHLGHNLPDRTGNRYCINLVSVAGNEPVAEE